MAARLGTPGSGAPPASPSPKPCLKALKWAPWPPHGHLSGYSCFRRAMSSSITSSGRSLISSMFSQPITCGRGPRPPSLCPQMLSGLILPCWEKHKRRVCIAGAGAPVITKQVWPVRLLSRMHRARSVAHRQGRPAASSCSATCMMSMQGSQLRRVLHLPVICRLQARVPRRDIDNLSSAQSSELSCACMAHLHALMMLHRTESG